LEAAAVALHSGGIEGAWIAVWRERGRKEGRIGSLVTWQKVQACCASGRSDSETRERVEMEMKSR
jgi:hypothetical protein